ncbi:MAG: PIN domain-containing protein [Candidatus Nanohaloarchaea archaeon]
MNERAALDTNVLVYALNTDAGEKHETAKELVLDARQNDTAVPLQCLGECYNVVLTKNRADADTARTFLEELKHGPFTILAAGTEAFNNAVQSEERFWDRLIEVTVLNHGYGTLYTENEDDFESIETVNPFE